MAERKKKTTSSKKKAPAKKKAAAKKKAPAKKKAVAKKKAPAKKSRKKVSPEERWKMIAEAAYYLAEKRGFAGDPVNDWIDAEQAIDGRLAGK